jgi:hypothetical protein
VALKTISEIISMKYFLFMHRFVVCHNSDYLHFWGSVETLPSETREFRYRGSQYVVRQFHLVSSSQFVLSKSQIKYL